MKKLISILISFGFLLTFGQQADQIIRLGDITSPPYPAIIHMELNGDQLIATTGDIVYIYEYLNGDWQETATIPADDPFRVGIIDSFAMYSTTEITKTYETPYEHDYFEEQRVDTWYYKKTASGWKFDHKVENQYIAGSQGNSVLCLQTGTYFYYLSDVGSKFEDMQVLGQRRTRKQGKWVYTNSLFSEEFSRQGPGRTEPQIGLKKILEFINFVLAPDEDHYAFGMPFEDGFWGWYPSSYDPPSERYISRFSTPSTSPKIDTLIGVERIWVLEQDQALINYQYAISRYGDCRSHPGSVIKHQENAWIFPDTINYANGSLKGNRLALQAYDGCNPDQFGVILFQGTTSQWIPYDTLHPAETLSDPGFGKLIDDSGTVLAIASPAVNAIYLYYSSPITPPLGCTLPLGMIHTDIGRTGMDGEVCYKNGTYTITASGSDIWRAKDGFHFIYLPLEGDIDISMHIADFDRRYPSNELGLMIRETLDRDSKHAYIAQKTDGRSLYVTREQSGARSKGFWSYPAQRPDWLRIKRVGQQITGYRSMDGQNWQPYLVKQLPLNQQVYAGIATTTAEHGTPMTHVIDYVSINQAAYKRTGQQQEIGELTSEREQLQIDPNWPVLRLHYMAEAGQLTITGLGLEQATSVGVYTLQGRKVLHQSIQQLQALPLSTEGLSKGIYLIRIEGPGLYTTQKLMIR